ncbi:MAG: hypothetical protein ACOC1O_05225, partial [bacterium]
WSLLAILFSLSLLLSLTKENTLHTIYLFGLAIFLTIGIAYSVVYSLLGGLAILFIGNIVWLMLYQLSKYIKSINDNININASVK